jgi:hypothetical protein
MHGMTPYGHLRVGGKPVPVDRLALMVAAQLGEVKRLLVELESATVFSRTEDGTIYSRRMVRDERLRAIRSEVGSLGGSPKLKSGYNKPGFIYKMLRSSDGAVKIGISANPSKRLWKVRQQFPCDTITLAETAYVPDMGSREAEIHQALSRWAQGEWFSLDVEGNDALLGAWGRLAAPLKGNYKETVKVNDKVSPNQSVEEEEEEEEERKKEIKSGRVEPEFSIPDWVPMEPWLDYVLARLAKRAPIKSPSQAQYCIAKLKKLRDLGHDPAEVLAQSIANGWTGLFPVSQEKNANGKPTIAEQTRRNAAIALERHEARAANLGGAE